MSSAFGHHTNYTPSTSDSMVKSRKGKFRYPCLLCKDMHLTYLCPRMDEASKLLEYITIPRQQLPTYYRKFSLEPQLVDQVVNSDPSLVDPTLPLKSEVEVVKSMSSPPDPTLSSESVNTEVVVLTKSSSCSSLPVENEPKPATVFMLRSDCS